MRARVVAVALLLVGSASHADNANAKSDLVFQAGDYVVVLARLAECMSWSRRPIVLLPVAHDERMSLLGLPAVPVRGRNPAAVSRLLRQRYHEALPERPIPPLEIQLVRGRGHFSEILPLYLWSRRHLLDRSCPLEADQTPPPDWQHPQEVPPAVRKLLGEIA